MLGYGGTGSIAYTNTVHSDSGLSNCMIKDVPAANIIHRDLSG
jgi:hypothetical protein